MNVSPDFSPSIKIMKPYFMFSGFFYLLSMIWLFFINPNNELENFSIIAWVHLYMLGFVMMSIFSAMAQLGPVVVETKHYNVNVFRYIFIFLILGLGIIIAGFYIDIRMVIYGGLSVLVGMSIYAIEFFLTLKTARRKTSITNAMKMSNVFLLLGVLSGLIMAAGFSGYVEINPHSILKAHTFGLVVGFVILLIMGISIILVPMFGSSKRISDNEFSNSFYTLMFAVIVMFLSPFLLTKYLEYISYSLTILAILLYFYQLFKMIKSRKKVIHDIWARSMYVGFSSFVVSFLLLISYLFTNDTLILKLATWIMFIGFFGFLIIGNFYKIVPFLIWFQIYSPLIEEQNVPMLHDLIPQKLTKLQFIFSSIGLGVSSLGIFIKSYVIFYTGAAILVIGATLFFISIYKMFKKNL